MWQEVKSGGFLDLAKLKNYESEFEEGQRGLLDINLRYVVPQSVASELENRLKQSGVEDCQVVVGSPRLKVYFRKGFPWLAIIAATILAMVVLAILIIGWSLFKEVVPESLQPLVGTFGLFAIIVILVATALRKPTQGGSYGY